MKTGDNILELPASDFRMYGMALSCVFVLLVVSIFGTPYMVCATVAYFIMIAGLYLRKARKLHYTLMSMALLLDVGLVLSLEIQRNAVKTALDMSLSPIQQMHIVASTVALVLYFPIVGLGVYHARKTSKRRGLKGWHAKLGIIAFVFRSLGFILMFTLLSHVKRGG